MPKILTLAEAADFLRVSTWTLSNEVKENRVPHFRVGRRLRFDVSALERMSAVQSSDCGSQRGAEQDA